MADVTPQEAARIIAHMNSEHSESLIHYLEHYGKIPESKAIDPAITVFSTPLMKIEYGTKGARKTFEYKFEEPMLAGQARKRLEEMHQDARKGCGISNVRINEFWPVLDVLAIVSIVGFVGIQTALVVSSPRTLTTWLPWAATQVKKLFALLNITPTPESVGYGIKTLFTVPFYLAHAVECCTILQKLFKKYSTTDKTVRLQWIVTTLFAGVGCWSCLKRQGEKQEAEQEAKLKAQ